MMDSVLATLWGAMWRVQLDSASGVELDSVSVSPSG
jgi:hypothetical protein